VLLSFAFMEKEDCEHLVSLNLEDKLAISLVFVLIEHDFSWD